MQETGNAPHNSTAAIATENLTRRFGDLVAVQDVALRVEPGQFYGFLGPNGAGKSTTIKMLTGLLAPTSGSIRILGEDLTGNSAELKRQIGVVPEGMALFGRLTASGYLRFVGRLCTHIGIIHRGELVAQGSLEELRAGMLRAAPPPKRGEEPRVTEPLGNRSLEQIFLEIVGTDRAGNVGAHAPEELSWLS